MPLIVADRAQLITSRREQQKSIVASRKRKLRELYSVSYSLEPIPKFATQFDVAPTSPAETQFLEQNDISKNRLFDERSLSTKRRLRSDAAKNGHRVIGNDNLSESSNGSDVKKSTTNVPCGDTAKPQRKFQDRLEIPADDGNHSRANQHDMARLREPSPEIAREVQLTEHERQEAARAVENDDGFFVGVSEAQRIRTMVESRPNSPGINPQKAIHVSAEDEANLLSSGPRLPKDEHHKATTVHLPSNEIQEEKARQKRSELAGPAEESRRIEDLSIKLPPHTSRAPEPMSSPGSTIGPPSATTPGIHEASTDTSPENDGSRYNGIDETADKDDGSPRTPPELMPDEQELSGKEEHDRRLSAQMDLVRNEILASSPTAADAQLRLEDEQAAASGPAGRQDIATFDQKDAITGTTGNTVHDPIDEDDEVVGVPTPEDEGVPEHEARPASILQVATTEPMDIDRDIAEDPVISNVAHRLSADLATVTSEPEQAATDPSISSPCAAVTATAPTTPPLERSRTRLSSGAMRQKSVSEILGEVPRHGAAVERTSGRNGSSSRSTTPQTPESRARSFTARAKDKDRSKLSAVVFAKQPLNRSTGNSASLPGNAKSQLSDNTNYFMPLMQAQALNATKGYQSLDSMLQSSNKTITTANAYVPYYDNQNQKILRRIHSLQSSDKWSFRQPKRASEPNRPTTHWDELLKEMKWMRTDFREEKKWRMAMAKNFAYACVEWVEANDDERRNLQVKVKLHTTNLAENCAHAAIGNSNDRADEEHIAPDLESSTDNDSPTDDFEDEISTSMIDSIAPTAIFSLTDDDVVFHLNRSAATDKILNELPMYGTPLCIPSSDLPTSDVDPDAAWRRPALPLSKYVEGKIVLKIDGPPKKRSRYDYEEESDDEDRIVIGDQTGLKKATESPSIDVALFNPENKHIRDRIQAGHQFRPPSENPMPLQSFFESRSSSHWLWAEDDELKGLVREYSYNWQLISSMLSSRSLFTSGAERRTPWECFERWIFLEGLPADMSKTHYFRAYNHRLEAAQRTLMIQTQQAAQQPQPNGSNPSMPQVRRRTTTSIRVERKRNNKHLTLVDAMRKLAKKRETNLQKQAHAQSLASMRKEQNQAPHSVAVRHTPQEFSKLKHDREMQIQDRMQRLQMQQNAQRQALQQVRNAQPHPNTQQFNGIPPNSGVQTARAPPLGNTSAVVHHPSMQGRPNQLAVPGQTIPQAPMQPASTGMQAPPLPNSLPRTQSMQMNGVTHGQMQNVPGLTGQQRIPASTDQAELYRRTAAVREAQRQKIAQTHQQGQQTGQSPQMRNSPSNIHPNMNGTNQQGFPQNNPPIMAGLNAANSNGVSTPSVNGYNVSSSGQSGSPRSAPPYQAQQQSGRVNLPAVELEAKLRVSNPNATTEQIRKMVSDYLSSHGRQLANQSTPQSMQSAQAQSAMMAAAGATANGMPVSFANGTQPDPRQYAQMLRAQQREQAQANQANQATQTPGQAQTQAQQPQAQAPMQPQAIQQNRSASAGSVNNS